MDNCDYTFPYHYIDISRGYDNIKEINEHLFLIEEVKKIIGNEYIKRQIKANKKIKELKIADLGCGDGRLIYELGKEGYKVDGYDRNKKATDFAKAFNQDCLIFRQDIKEMKIRIKYDIIRTYTL